MIPAELGLTKALIDTFVTTDVYESPRIVNAVSQILGDVDEAEATTVTSAYSTALASLRSDLPRARVAAEVALQFDLYECLGAVRQLATETPEPHLMAVAAALAANPLVPTASKTSVRDLVDGSSASEELRRMLLVRLGDVQASNARERMIEAQLWPGRLNASEVSRFAPPVYVANDMAPANDYWKVVSALVAAGARVRRVSMQAPPATGSAWVHPDAPVVSWTGVTVGKWKEISGARQVRSVIAPASLNGVLVLPRLMNQVRQLLPPGWRLRPSATSTGTLAATESAPFNVDTLSEGAFDSMEMMFLGAARRSALSQLSREVLQPRSADRNRWSFDQLVTLRLVQGFKTLRKGRLDVNRVYSRVHEIATANTESEVAFDARGDLYVRRDGGNFKNVETDQDAIDDVLRVDDAFKPFKLGGGLTVPDLLHPSSRTAVDPRILGGTPTIRGRRMSARSVFELHSLRNEAVVRSAYPELSPADIQDAVRVGQLILNPRF